MRFWLIHGAMPVAVSGIILYFLLGHHLDQSIASSWAYDDVRGWIGTHQWWANTLIHRGGRAVVALVVISALSLWAASFGVARFHSWRRPALYVALSVLLGTGLVGLLKDTTNIDCPWSLSGFGGDRPYVGLFESRPAGLPHARCFPGAHSSSGFALMCFYFVLRDRSRRAALWALVGGFLAGALFAFGQEARGAHFLSHDLTSATLVWCVLLTLYAAMLRGKGTWVQARHCLSDQGRSDHDSHRAIAPARTEPLAGQHHP